MKRLQTIGQAVVVLSLLGFVYPNGTASAASPNAKQDTKTSAKAVQVVDVALASQGTLTGQVVDGQGLALDGAAVTVRQGKQIVAKAVTDKSGLFVVRNLRGGVYQVTAGQATGVYRVWSANTAPPSARPQVLLVSSSQTVRGQIYDDSGFGLIDGAGIGSFIGVAGGIAGITLGTIGIVQANDNEDRIQALENSP